MRNLAGRPGNGTIRPNGHVIDPALLVIRAKDPVLAVRTSFADLSIIATGYDTRSIGSARKNGSRVDPNGALSFCDIQ